MRTEKTIASFALQSRLCQEVVNMAWHKVPNVGSVDVVHSTQAPVANGQVGDEGRRG